jgi:excisionase family DNA binding protein
VRNTEHVPSNTLLTPAEVAAAFRVDPKTVTRWAKAGKLNSIRTLGGHRRYLATEIHAILADGDAQTYLLARGTAVPAPRGFALRN